MGLPGAEGPKGGQERGRKTGSDRQASIVLPALQVAPGPGRPGDETTFGLSRNRLLRGGAKDAARGLSLSLFSRRGPRSSAFLSRRWALAACILWGCWQPVPLIPRAAVLFGRASPCASPWAHREGGADAGGDRYPDVDSHGRDNSTPRRILAKCWHHLRNVCIGAALPVESCVLRWGDTEHLGLSVLGMGCMCGPEADQF